MIHRIDEKSTHTVEGCLFTVESCLDIFDCTYILCIMNKIVTLGIFPPMIFRLRVVTKPSTRWTQWRQFVQPSSCQNVGTMKRWAFGSIWACWDLVLSICDTGSNCDRRDIRKWRVWRVWWRRWICWRQWNYQGCTLGKNGERVTI